MSHLPARDLQAALLGLTLFASVSSEALTLKASDDTDIDRLNPTRINGAGQQVLIRTAGGERSGFVRFDLADLPLDVPVTRATLRLWVNSVPTPGSLDIAAPLTEWREGTLNANTIPALGVAQATAAIPAGARNTYVNVNVTSLVQQWQTGDLPNFGLALLPKPGGAISVAFDSKENTTTSHPMELEITLAGPAGPRGPQGPAGPQGPQGPAGTGFSEYQVVSKTATVSAGTGVAEVRAACPLTKRVLGGGCTGSNLFSTQLAGGTEWSCAFFRDSITRNVTATAICATVR
ncbi:MAG: collagen triple helix repeat protein [Proteobacteria bacterium]|nr:collagen triple helix repeat protein [Pseudomonadota bacterium]